MMNQPLVSIHIITYNQIQFVRETIESAINQDYSNIEIIVADDGSTDGTADIVLEYASRYPGKVIPIVGSENLGITGNSNRGLKACKGKYIAFLGGDDLMSPQKIKLQAEYMENDTECDVCYHDVEIFDSTTGKIISLYSAISRPINGGIKEAIRYGTVNCASASMYRTKKIPEDGFDCRLSVVSDWLFTIQTLADGGKFCFISSVLGKYRKHSANVSNINSPFRARGFADMLQTCAICMNNYPIYLTDVLTRLSAIFREARALGGGKFYAPYLWASLRLNVSLKSAGGLLVYYVSARKIMI